MIYTLTLNPALDYVVKITNFNTGSVNRTNSEEVFAGGKGINVSLVLNNLGIESQVLGFIAGFTGEEIERRIKAVGCKTDFLKLSYGLSRINVKIRADKESEINGVGPVINEDDLKRLYSQLGKLTNGDMLILAGSIPGSLPKTVYENIMKTLKDKNIKFIVDTNGEALLSVLKYKPFLIKPNHHELGELFNVELKKIDDIIKYGIKLKEMGAQNVLISMAGDGAILIDYSKNVYVSTAPKGEVKNSVGAGDSMVGGFIAGYLPNNNIFEGFKLGLATGSASAFSDGLATKEKIYEILDEMERIEQINCSDSID